MSVTMKVDTRELNRGIEQLIRVSRIADHKALRNTAKGLMFSLVRFTFLMKKRPKKGFKKLHEARAKYAKGRARLGWWAAWKHLGNSGAPNIGDGPLKDRGEGGITDNSKRIVFPHITVFNEVPYIEANKERLRNFQSAADRQLKQFLVPAIDRAYGRILRRHIG